VCHFINPIFLDGWCIKVVTDKSKKWNESWITSGGVKFFAVIIPDSSVERARVGYWRRVWVGVTTAAGYCLQGGTTPPDVLPVAQSGA
jgi:hypothetical protein